MTFLQPLLLLALPLLAIPVVIHLMHLRRHHSTPWAAMQFLLQATKMNQGYNKLRQWLVLAARTLAIAALVLLASRPLASGISGWLANDLSELTVVVLDRSPSMQMQNGQSGHTKLTAAKQRLLEILSLNGERPVSVVTQGYSEPIVIKSSEDLLQDLRLSESALTANIPELLDIASVHLEQSGAHKATVWIASDLRESDWRSSSSTWGTVRNGFAAKGKDVRFQILEFAPLQPNLAIQIIDCKSLVGETESFLSLSFRLLNTMPASSDSSVAAINGTIPVEVQIDQATSITNVELNQGVAEVTDLRIPVDMASNSLGRGYGALRIPADSNTADNTAYFAFEASRPRKTVVVTEDPQAVEAIRIAASISPDPELKCESEIIDASGVKDIAWSDVLLLVWNLGSPTPDEQLLLNAFVESGGQVLLVPPNSPTGESLLGVTWNDWLAVEATAQLASSPGDESVATTATAADGSLNVKGITDSPQGAALSTPDSLGQRVTQWRNDTRLLSNTNSGEALPLADVEITRVCGMQFDESVVTSVLAKVQSDVPWLVQIQSESDQAKGSVYALATDTSPRSSNLATNGIALYIVVQRLIEEGNARKGNALLRTVNSSLKSQVNNSQLLLGPNEVVSSHQFETPGVIQQGNELFAQNRSVSEDVATTITEESLADVFGNLTWFKTDASSDNSSLAQEIWRWFAIAMLLLLIAESLLTVPAAPRVKRSV